MDEVLVALPVTTLLAIGALGAVGLICIAIGGTVRLAQLVRDRRRRPREES